MLFHFISFCVLKFIGKIWKQIDFYLKIQDMWKVLFDAIQWKYSTMMDLLYICSVQCCRPVAPNLFGTRGWFFHGMGWGGWFQDDSKYITFTVYFISIVIISAPPQIIRY